MADEMDVFFGLDTPEGQAALRRERDKIAREIAANQTPLGADFERVWDENTDKLHEQ